MKISRTLPLLTGFALILGGLASAQTVNISDPNAETAIRDAIGKANGDITVADLEKVEELTISGLGISRLTLPEGMINLQKMDLSNNGFVASLFSPLNLPKDLPSLTELNMSGNLLTSLSFANNYTNLEILNAADTRLANYTLPEELSKLKSLNLTTCPLKSLKFEGDHSALEELIVDRTLLEELVLPEGLTGLKTLSARVCRDLEHLTLSGDMESLELLLCERSKLQELIIPFGVVNLVEINAEQNEIKEFTMPPGLTRLEKLNLDVNELKELDFPKGLTSLDEFFAIDNEELLSENGVVYIREDLNETGREKITNLFFEATLIVVRDPAIWSDFEWTTNNGFRVRVAATPGYYKVESSNDLQTWTTLNEEILIEDKEAPVQISDKSARRVPTRWFRAEFLEEF